MANIKSINGNALLVDSTGIENGSVTDDKLVQTGGILTSFEDAMSNIYAELSSTAPTIIIGSAINTNTGAVSNNQTARARTGSLNFTTSKRRAVMMSDSNYQIQALGYSAASVIAANYMRRITYGWVSSGNIIYIPSDIPVVALMFKNVEGTTLDSDDATAIAEGLKFFEVTDSTLSVQNAAADAKAVGDEFARIGDLIETGTSLYFSSDSTSRVSTFDNVIAMYDALMSNHNIYMTKTVLTHGSLSLPEYTLTRGNYNISGQRTRDSVVKKPKILICAGIHGYEQSSVMSLYEFCKTLSEDAFTLYALTEYFEFRVIPIVSKSGYDNNSRINANGVNINRNFASSSWVLTETGSDYSGAAPGDQDETQIVQDWLLDNSDAVLFIDWHNSNYVAEVTCSLMTDTSDTAKKIKRWYLNAIDAIAPHWRRDRVITANGTIYRYTGLSTATGSSVSYASEHGINAMTLETSWNVQSSGQHSNMTIGVGAEAISAIIAGMKRHILDGEL